MCEDFFAPFCAPDDAASRSAPVDGEVHAKRQVDTDKVTLINGTKMKTRTTKPLPCSSQSKKSTKAQKLLSRFRSLAKAGKSKQDIMETLNIRTPKYDALYGQLVREDEHIYPIPDMPRKKLVGKNQNLYIPLSVIKALGLEDVFRPGCKLGYVKKGNGILTFVKEQESLDSPATQESQEQERAIPTGIENSSVATAKAPMPLSDEQVGHLFAWLAAGGPFAPQPKTAIETVAEKMVLEQQAQHLPKHKVAIHSASEASS